MTAPHAPQMADTADKRPITVFGPQLAVIYLGRHYLAFRDSARVETITQHFDLLVREAEVGARDMPDYLRSMRDGVA